MINPLESARKRKEEIHNKKTDKLDPISISKVYYDKEEMMVSIPRWRSHPIHENRATESIWTEPCNPLLRATKSTKRATSA